MENVNLLLEVFNLLTKGGMILAVALIYGLGFFVKNYTKLNNNYIPWINLCLGGVIGFIFISQSANGFGTGLVVGMTSVVFNAYIGRNVEEKLKKVIDILLNKKTNQ